MAWWNEAAGDQTPPVTLDCVAAWFDAQGFAYELTEDNPGLAAGFGRYGYVIEVLDDIMAVHARFWTDLPDDEATTAGVRGLLSQFNWLRVVPTLASFVNDDGHQMAAQIPVFIAQDLNESKSLTFITARTGPKTSSWAMRCSGVMPSTMVKSA